MSAPSLDRSKRERTLQCDTMTIEELHRNACDKCEETYVDPDTGLTVFTAYAHQKRGSCCGSGCRHCPYGHINVRKRATTKSQTQRRAHGRVEQPGVLRGVALWTLRLLARFVVFLIERISSRKNPPISQVKTARRQLKSSLRTRSSLYTRKGDGGYSRLLDGEARPKCAIVYEAMGDLDELSVKLGFAAFYTSRTDTQNTMHGAQQTLLEAGAVLAATGSQSEGSRTSRLARRAFDPSVIEHLESQIDAIDASLPRLRHFVLPRQPESALALHDARAVCRRAERHIWRFVMEREAVDENPSDSVAIRSVAAYLNRLSDYLFAAARQEVHEDDARDSNELLYNISAVVQQRLQNIRRDST